MPNLSCLSTQGPLLASPPSRSFSLEMFSPLGLSRDLLVPRRKTRVFRPLEGWPHSPHLFSGFAAPCAHSESCFLVQHLNIAAPRPSVTSRQSLPTTSCSSSAASHLCALCTVSSSALSVSLPASAGSPPLPFGSKRSVCLCFQVKITGLDLLSSLVSFQGLMLTPEWQASCRRGLFRTSSGLSVISCSHQIQGHQPCR